MIEAEGEGRVGIFIGLHAGEAHAQQHGEDEALHRPFAVAGLHGVVRPGHRRARSQQNQGVEQREMPGIEGHDARRAASCRCDDITVEISPN